MLTKPDKAKQLESIIVQMATSGQIGGKLSENDLIGLVERVNAQTQKTTSVKVSDKYVGYEIALKIFMNQNLIKYFYSSLIVAEQLLTVMMMIGDCNCLHGYAINI